MKLFLLKLAGPGEEAVALVTFTRCPLLSPVLISTNLVRRKTKLLHIGMVQNLGLLVVRPSLELQVQVGLDLVPEEEGAQGLIDDN